VNMFKSTTAETLLILGGIGHLALAFSSLAIPRLLGWQEELQALRPLTRRVFRTYSFYIFGIHLWFATLSIVAAGPLAAGGLLSRLITGFISLYWAVRIVVQFGVYDRSVRRERLLFRVGEVCYVVLFAALTLIYGFVAIRG